jgi:hypothetical protein
MKYWLGAVIVMALAAGVLWLVSPGKPVAAVQPVPDETLSQSRLNPRASAGRANPAEQEAIESQAGEPVVMTEASPAPPKPVALASLAEPPQGPELAPGLTPMTVMENVRATFRNYSSRFGGNPVGTNQEITRTLNGANPGKTPLLRPEDGLEINDHGELVDNWGTPFFFHQLSRTEIEIHSAGPDRKMWTADDLVMK